jgi:hypothetical protein
MCNVRPFGEKARVAIAGGPYSVGKGVNALNGFFDQFPRPKGTWLCSLEAETLGCLLEVELSRASKVCKISEMF